MRIPAINFFNKSLIYQIGAVVLFVEFMALTSLGLYYSDRFSREVDQNLEAKVQLPGKLMNRQLLRYESVGDKKVMIDLVGEEFENGIVVGADGRVYYSFNPEYVGKNVFDIPGVDVDILAGGGEPTLIRDKRDGKGYIVSLTPLTAYEGAKPFFHVYIRAGTEGARIHKKRIAALFIFGSAFCILITSLGIISYSRQFVTQPLKELQQNADALRRGELDVTIPSDRVDEIGNLADSFSAMRDSIRQKLQELEKANVAMEEREGRLQALIKALPDRILVFNWEGRFLEIYSTGQDNLVLKKEDLLGNLLHDIQNKAFADSALETIRKTITTGESQEIEYMLEGTEEDVWFESRTSRIGNESGDKGKVVWVARNITYRKKIESHLTEAKEDAERVNLRLRELDRTKSSLVSSVSHELRTPLTSLLGFSKLIMKNFSKNFWPLAKNDHKLLTKGSQIVENLNILIHEGDRLTRLINDVLDLNKIEMGYTQWREDRINPADLARKAVNAVSGQFNDNPKVTLVTQIDDDLPHIVVDSDRLIQVLLNLLTNAAKFTQEGTVILQANTPATGLIRFAVSDTGMGIPPHEQQRIFDIFHQAGEYGPADDKPQGAGLGLAICREIIEHYEGNIWVESEVGKGSTFYIELPVS